MKLMEASDENAACCACRRELDKVHHSVLIIDELVFCAALEDLAPSCCSEDASQRYERGSTSPPW